MDQERGGHALPILAGLKRHAQADPVAVIVEEKAAASAALRDPARLVGGRAPARWRTRGAQAGCALRRTEAGRSRRTVWRPFAGGGWHELSAHGGGQFNA